MRILITGSNGLLGQKLVDRLSSEIHAVRGIDLQPESVNRLPGFDYHRLDVTSRKSTDTVIRDWNPEIIIHCAAMTGVDACETERELCWKINVSGTENVCRVAALCGARVIYISTDYVFNGEKGPYSEDDNPNPLGYYAKSKLAGENVVRGTTENPTIIRSIVIYGYGIAIKSSFVTWLLGELRENRPVRIVNDQWGNSTLADDFAEAIDRMILLEKSGLFHMGGKGFMSRFEMAQRVARYFGLDESLITPITTAELKQPAKRPLRSGLITTKAETELYYNFRDLEQSLRIYKACEENII